MVEFRLKACCLVLAGAVTLFCSPGRTQSVGTYGGLQANGLSINLVVTRDKGQLIVDAFAAQTQTTCRDGASLVIDSGYGPVGPINNGSGHNAYGYGPYYGSISYTFDNTTHTVSGFVEQTYSIFVPQSSTAAAPAKSTFCTSGNQAFAAVLGRSVAVDPKVKVVHYRRPE